MTNQVILLDSTGRNVIERSLERGWRGLVLRVTTERIPNDVEWLDHHPDQHLVIVNLGGVTTHLEARISSGGRYVGPPILGDLSIIPAGCAFGGVYRGEVAQYASLLIDSAMLDDLSTRRLRPRLGHRDELLFAATRELVRIAERDDPQSALYGDALAQTIALRLIEADGNEFSACKAPRLAPPAVERLQEFVNGHLDEPIRLDDLASVAALPMRRFLPAFRASFGSSPAQWVMAQRLRRARWMLAYTDDSIAIIAYRTGFAHQSHMTSAFRRHQGVTPAALRRQWRS